MINVIAPREDVDAQVILRDAGVRLLRMRLGHDDLELRPGLPPYSHSIHLR